MIETTRKKLKNNKGFTLIELVVVIAVIGILASIAIPRVTGITSNAKTQATKQHLRILNSALERYKAVSGDDKLSGVIATGDSDAEAARKVIVHLKGKDYLSNDTSTTTLPNESSVKFDKENYYFKE